MHALWTSGLRRRKQLPMNRATSPTLTKYLGSIIAIALNIALVLGILGYFGIQTTSFAAMLAGAGVAIGAAWCNRAASPATASTCASW